MKSRISSSMLKKVMNKKIFNNNLLNNKITNNRITLLIVAAIAFFSLYLHIVNSHFSAVLLFFLTGALVYGFTKNMVIVLGSAFLVTTIASMLARSFGFKEGFKEGEANMKKPKKAKKKEEEEKEEGSDEEDGDGDGDGVSENIEKALKGLPEDIDASVTKKKANAAGFDNKQKLSPALFNTPSKKNMEQQLGKASEAEKAYDNLEKIMGTENINSISSDTKDLIKQQNELIKQLKTMTPALNSAMASLGGLDLNKLTGMFNSATKNLSEIKDE
jgi:hypothetical protein